MNKLKVFSWNTNLNIGSIQAISKNPLDDFDFNEILEVFALTHTWIKDCLQGFDILNVENTEKINATEQLRQIATDEELRKLTKIQPLLKSLIEK